jgi:hypothetical protein
MEFFISKERIETANVMRFQVAAKAADRGDSPPGVVAMKVRCDYLQYAIERIERAPHHRLLDRAS